MTKDELIQAYASQFYNVVEQFGVQIELGHPELTRAEIGKMLDAAFEFSLLHSQFDPTA